MHTCAYHPESSGQSIESQDRPPVFPLLLGTVVVPRCVYLWCQNVVMPQPHVIYGREVIKSLELKVGRVAEGRIGEVFLHPGNHCPQIQP